MQENRGCSDNSCTKTSCEGCEKKEQSMIEMQNQYSSVKKIIGVVSGKGGVGKSMVTSMMAVMMQRKGFQTAVLDADITGPSIPKAFGITEKAYQVREGIVPADSKTGIKLMSTNLILENDTDPVIWRGPMIGNAVKQFWTDVVWGDIDYMFIDMPPGTGDVPLTVFQSIPVDGIIIVTSPQELVSMIVGKAVKMAQKMNIPILGLVENMGYIECPHCGKQIEPFGKSRVEDNANKHGIKHCARLPIDPSIASLCDNGRIEEFKGDWLAELSQQMTKI